MIKIPFIKYPCFSEEIIIDNIPLRFSFNWNDRGEYWTLEILDANNIIIASGIKIVLEYPLIEYYPAFNIPRGEFLAIDPSGTIQRISQDDFADDKIELLYFTADELEDIKAAPYCHNLIES
jgi:hypothetical protein